MPGSLADVARRAGVSIATASRALNAAKHPVSPEVRERVFAAAREVGYSPSAVGRALVEGRSRIIGLIVGDIADPYFAEITRGAEDVARRQGHLAIVCNADRSPVAELAYLRLLIDYHAKGVIFAGGGQVDGADGNASGSGGVAEAVEEARAAGIGVVALAARSFPAAKVAIDNVAACYDVTSYVLSLGHRRLAYVEGPAGSTTTIARLEGFRRATSEAGLDASQVFPGNFDYESGQAAALRMIGRSLPDAVIAANDESAIGVLMTLRAAGIDVPGDVSVAGIDDTRPSRFVDLTTVSVPMYELGAIGARRILEEEVDGRLPTILPHRLVPRGTTARRRA